MKIINVLLMGLLTCLAGGEGVKAQQPVCPSGGCYCSIDGSCIQCPSCSSSGCCSSANLPFVPQSDIVYTFSSETYFMCDSSEGLSPFPLKNNVYQCSTNEPTLVQPEFNKKRHIKIDSTVIYRFPEVMVFRCDEAPVVVNKGLPSQYYICPVLSDEKTKLKANK